MPTFFQHHETSKVAIKNLDLATFLKDIRIGKYQDPVLKVRTAKSKEEKHDAKKRLPCIMPSANSIGKKVDQIEEHTGYMVADIDNIPDDKMQEYKDQLMKDPYTYAMFVSAGGHGLCVFVQVPKTKTAQAHTLRFQALAEYYYKDHDIIIDTAGSNWNRTRAVSYDPYLYINPNSLVFKASAEGPKQPKKVETVWGDSDVERVIGEVVRRGIDLTNGYQNWIDVGFAIHSWNPNEQGRLAYHDLSRQNPKYNERQTDTHWKSFSKPGAGRPITVGTLFWMAKQHGIEGVSRATKEVATIAAMAKRGGATIEVARQRLAAMNLEDPDNVAERVYAMQDAEPANIDLLTDDQIALYLKTTHDLKFNEVTGIVEVDEQDMNDRIMNTMVLNIRQCVSEKASTAQVEMIVNSDRVVSYNPILDYINQLPEAKGIIIEHDACFMPLTYKLVQGFANPAQMPIDLYAYKFFSKWCLSLAGALVTMQADECVYNEFLPVLMGKYGDGKTRLIKSLLPPELRKYFGVAHFTDEASAKKDLEILMTQRIIVLNDELRGTNKAQANSIKAAMSASDYDIRRPYARNNEKIRRIASMIATANEHDVIADITGNRRIIPILTKEIDRASIDQIDRAELLAEWVTAFKMGARHWLTAAENDELNELTSGNQETILEEELVLGYVKKAAFGIPLSEIVRKLQMLAPVGHKLQMKQVKAALLKHKHEPKPRHGTWLYNVKVDDVPQAPADTDDPMPF